MLTRLLIWFLIHTKCKAGNQGGKRQINLTTKIKGSQLDTKINYTQST